MMIAVEVCNISKSYKIGKSIFQSGATHVALQNISFELPKGQRLGVIGKNGAGKSTLLKILSQITAPTSGTVKIHGSVGSLLEVGTGFHPEMTGRENIFLNGSILGMSKGEIKSKFAEIVEFSGVGKFIDTPIKRYSSGMQTRLAFSVAAFLEPEIMIIDEVLAVGDVEFQDRCIAKMKDMTSSGRTILFVSHNMAAIRKFCDRCILLEHGVIVDDSFNVDAVVSRYLKTEASPKSIWQESNPQRFDILQPVRLCFRSLDNEILDRPFFPEEDITLDFEFVLKEIEPNLSIGMHLYSAGMEEILYSYNTDHRGFHTSALRLGRNTVSVKLPLLMLNNQEYVVKLAIGVLGSRALTSAEESNISVVFRVHENKMRSGFWHNKGNHIAPLLEWRAQ